MICQPSDVILIPFPFTDLSVAKKRPVYKVGQLADNTFSRVEEKMCKLLCKKST